MTTPSSKRPTGGQELPPLPRLESTYTQILGRAIHAAKQRSGLTQRVRSATRELMAVVPHTRRRFSALSLLGKIAVVVVLVGLGSGGTLAVHQLFGSGNPEVLRRRVHELLNVQDFVEAKRLLHLLAAASPGGLSSADKRQLVAPVQAGLERLQKELQKQAQDHAAAGRFSEGLLTLEAMDKAGLSPEWVAFARGEMLRSARRHAESVLAYGRFVEMVPASDRADDALFWIADAHRQLGQPAEARAMFERLLEEYPNTDFKSSAKRALGELGGH